MVFTISGGILLAANTSFVSMNQFHLYRLSNLGFSGIIKHDELGAHDDS